ncbi:type IV pilin [Halobellus captivus]|uniref:type IV pilin n=1 Tax=Halobellus captivus TaxID=2592614 RepID=UPI00119D3017|nr:type IV pilin N-terminal domain-containing protein [Halobellus captivus]
MNIKQLFTEERAVSPVIGVILMVAITVILAAVIGAFVLNLGQGIGQSAPQATFEINSTNLDSNQNATITHSAGDSIEKTNLYVNGDIVQDGAQVDNLLNTINGDTVSSGESFEVETNADNGTIRVTWQAEDGSSSSTLRTFEYQ